MFYLFVEMYVLILSSFFIWEVLSANSAEELITNDNGDINFRAYESIRTVQELNLNDSHFSPLENYQVNADKVTEADYPWIARVVHSRTQNIPHICTASCIDPAIFITAARCIYGLKINFTTIIYRGKRLPTFAFVLPTEVSKQGYDDIGFIIVKKKSIKRWAVIELFNSINRTDNVFRWFVNLDFTYGNINGKVVGYAAEKSKVQSWEPDKEFNLTALNVVIGLDICPRILTDMTTVKAFYVPCYYACSVEEYLRRRVECKKYHGVEGGALYDTLTKKLMGIATWGPFSAVHELPVGFAFANSATFFKDYTCARKIRNDNALLITKGYYQSLCSII